MKHTTCLCRFPLMRQASERGEETGEEGAFAVYTKRVLPPDTGPTNSLPKARIFHVPDESGMAAIERELIDRLARAGISKQDLGLGYCRSAGRPGGSDRQANGEGQRWAGADWWRGGPGQPAARGRNRCEGAAAVGRSQGFEGGSRVCRWQVASVARLGDREEAAQAGPEGGEQAEAGDLCKSGDSQLGEGRRSRGQGRSDSRSTKNLIPSSTLATGSTVLNH